MAWASTHVEFLSSVLQGDDSFRQVGGWPGSDSSSRHAFSASNGCIHRSLACTTVKAYDRVCWLDGSGSVLKAFPHNTHASANTLLCDFEQQRDFFRAVAIRAPKVFGLTSRHRIAQAFAYSSDVQWFLHIATFSC